MRRKATLLAAFAVVALALAPAISDARRGGGFSSGSRGSRTYQAPPSTNTAPSSQTFQRTQSAPAVAGATAAGAGAAAATRSAGMRSGLMGGLLGAGLFGLLLGGGLFGGLGSMAAIFGLLLQVALIGGVIWLVMRFLRNRRTATAAGPQAVGPQAYARDMPRDTGNPRPMPGGAAAMGGLRPAAAPAAASVPLEIVAADYDAFERNLAEVNEAWSRQDLEALRRLSTPEMTNYFAQDLKDLRGRGWTNVTSGTKLEAGDLSEAWTENGQDFATVAMRYSIVDVTTDASGAVVEGDPNTPQTVTELLTYTRYQGEPWRLSAIQQTG